MKFGSLLALALLASAPIFSETAEGEVTFTVVAPPEEPELLVVAPSDESTPLAFHCEPKPRPAARQTGRTVCRTAPARDTRNFCCDRGWNWCAGKFSIHGEALYWKPMINAFRWAQEEERGTQIRRNFQMQPDLSWGFRAGLGYERQCSFGEVSYLWFESHDTTGLVRTEFVMPIVIVGVGNQADDFQRAENRLTLRYQNVDLRWGQHLVRGSDCLVSLFGNLRWVDLQRKMRSSGINEQGQIGFWEQQSRFSGAALGVGASGQFGIWCGLSFLGQINGMAVIGERKVPRNFRNDRGTLTREQYPSNTAVLPALDARLGLRYAQMCAGATLSVELGYEMNHYWHALNYTGDGGLSIDQVPCQDIGFAGPYLKLRGSY